MTHPDLGNAPSRFSGLAPRYRSTRTAADLASNIPPFQDKPEHIASRRALSAAFSRRLAEVLDELDKRASGFVDRKSGDCDLVADISQPYALEVMQVFTGLYELDKKELATASALFFELFAPLGDADRFAKVNRGLQAFRDAALPIVARRREKPAKDLVSHLIATDVGDGLNNTEIADLTLLILADGIENIRAAVASALILIDDDARAAVSDGRRQGVVEEVLRLETPGQIIPRIVRRDTEIEGIPLRADKPVLLALGSANRDGAVFYNPDRFDPDRDHGEVQTFGRGRHSCIGAPLARAMIGALTSALVARNARVTDAARLRYVHRFGHRWPAAVPIRLG